MSNNLESNNLENYQYLSKINFPYAIYENL